MLHIKKAHKKFKEIPILQDLDITIESNSIVGLAGPSGSGKSTLLRCIQGLESLDSGEILFSGKTGFMFQDFQLFPHFNVLKNLTYAPGLQDNVSNCEQQANELLSILGLAGRSHCFPSQLSGGQKQRVALARSLMMKPDLLLCDEPTSGLDTVSIQDVVHLLKTVKAMRVSMIIASHDLVFLSQISDRIMLLKDGKIVVDINPGDYADPSSYLKAFYTKC